MISLCMIVKDEIDVFERCISSVKENMGTIIDEMIVVDTGSTDGTRELAEEMNCKVYDFEWCDDFSKARNYSASKAKNDWILVLDADEYIISKFSRGKIKKICNKDNKDYAFTVNIQNIGSDGNIINTAVVARLYNKKTYEFNYMIHEQLRHTGKKDTVNVNCQMIIKHTGYLKEVMEAKDKTTKYKKLLQNQLKVEPDNPYMLGQLGAIYHIEEDYEKAMEYLGKVVFNDKCVKLEYYSTMVVKYLKCLVALESYEAGLIFENVWQYCVDDDTYVYFMAKIYFETNNYEKCVDALLLCVNRDGLSNTDKIYSYYILGAIFNFFEEYENALKCYNVCGDFEDSKEKVKEIEEKIKNKK